MSYAAVGQGLECPGELLLIDKDGVELACVPSCPDEWAEGVQGNQRVCLFSPGARGGHPATPLPLAPAEGGAGLGAVVIWTGVLVGGLIAWRSFAR